MNFKLQSFQEKLIDKLTNHNEFEFYLTGSRYFRNTHDNSDFDYIVQDSGRVRAFLTSLGFEIKSLEHYNDTNTVCVYSRQYGEYAWEKIDVQCCRDVQEKLTAQVLIRRYFPEGLPRDKKFSKGIWEIVIQMVQLTAKHSKPVNSFEKPSLEEQTERLKKAWNLK